MSNNANEKRRLKAKIKKAQEELKSLRAELRKLEKIKEKIKKMREYAQTRPEYKPPKETIDRWTVEEKIRVKGLVRQYRQELIQHGYHVLPIKEVKFGYAVTKWGTCTPHEYIGGSMNVTLMFSRYNLLEGEEFLKNTILHELTHAIRECVDEHHGPRWQKYAKEISTLFDTDLQRTASSKTTKKLRRNYKWEVTCENCMSKWRYRVKTPVVRDALINHGDSLTCWCGASGQFNVKELPAPEETK